MGRILGGYICTTAIVQSRLLDLRPVSDLYRYYDTSASHVLQGEIVDGNAAIIGCFRLLVDIEGVQPYLVVADSTLVVLDGAKEDDHDFLHFLVDGWDFARISGMGGENVPFKFDLRCFPCLVRLLHRRRKKLLSNRSTLSNGLF